MAAIMIAIWCLRLSAAIRCLARNRKQRFTFSHRSACLVVRIFPNAQSCLRLIRALAVETHENWLEQHRYLNMEELREHKKLMLRQAA